MSKGYVVPGIQFAVLKGHHLEASAQFYAYRLYKGVTTNRLAIKLEVGPKDIIKLELVSMKTYQSMMNQEQNAPARYKSLLKKTFEKLREYYNLPKNVTPSFVGNLDLLLGVIKRYTKKSKAQLGLSKNVQLVMERTHLTVEEKRVFEQLLDIARRNTKKIDQEQKELIEKLEREVVEKARKKDRKAWELTQKKKREAEKLAQKKEKEAAKLAQKEEKEAAKLVQKQKREARPEKNEDKTKIESDQKEKKADSNAHSGIPPVDPGEEKNLLEKGVSWEVANKYIDPEILKEAFYEEATKRGILPPGRDGGMMSRMEMYRGHIETPEEWLERMKRKCLFNIYKTNNSSKIRIQMLYDESLKVKPEPGKASESTSGESQPRDNNLFQNNDIDQNQAQQQNQSDAERNRETLAALKEATINLINKYGQPSIDNNSTSSSKHKRKVESLELAAKAATDERLEKQAPGLTSLLYNIRKIAKNNPTEEDVVSVWNRARDLRRVLLEGNKGGPYSPDSLNRDYPDVVEEIRMMLSTEPTVQDQTQSPLNQDTSFKVNDATVHMGGKWPGYSAWSSGSPPSNGTRPLGVSNSTSVNFGAIPLGQNPPPLYSINGVNPSFYAQNQPPQGQNIPPQNQPLQNQNPPPLNTSGFGNQMFYHMGQNQLPVNGSQQFQAPPPASNQQQPYSVTNNLFTQNPPIDTTNADGTLGGGNQQFEESVLRASPSFSTQVPQVHHFQSFLTTYPPPGIRHPQPFIPSQPPPNQSQPFSPYQYQPPPTQDVLQQQQPLTPPSLTQDQVTPLCNNPQPTMAPVESSSLASDNAYITQASVPPQPQDEVLRGQYDMASTAVPHAYSWGTVATARVYPQFSPTGTNWTHVPPQQQKGINYGSQFNRYDRFNRYDGRNGRFNNRFNYNRWGTFNKQPFRRDMGDAWGGNSYNRYSNRRWNNRYENGEYAATSPPFVDNMGSYRTIPNQNQTFENRDPNNTTPSLSNDAPPTTPPNDSPSTKAFEQTTPLYDGAARPSAKYTKRTMINRILKNVLGMNKDETMAIAKEMFKGIGNAINVRVRVEKKKKEPDVRVVKGKAKKSTLKTEKLDNTDSIDIIPGGKYGRNSVKSLSSISLTSNSNEDGLGAIFNRMNGRQSTFQKVSTKHYQVNKQNPTSAFGYVRDFLLNYTKKVYNVLPRIPYLTKYMNSPQQPKLLH